MNFTGPLVMKMWRRACSMPGGARLMSWTIGRLVPYTGSISPTIEVLEEGYAEASMADTRSVRNHLKSVHALASANLAEFTGSLAIVTRMPETCRWIVTGLSYEYLKKARGRLTARCDFRTQELPESGQCHARVMVFDASGATCVEAKVTLKISPRP